MLHGRYRANTLLALRHFVCVCLNICHSPHQPQTCPRPSSAWLHTRAVVHIVMCLWLCVHVVHESKIHWFIFCCWEALSSPPITNTYTYTQSRTIVTKTTAVMVVFVLSEVLGCDALTVFPQPCHLCCSAVTLTTMAAACEPARLPRTQRWLSQPLTSEAATKRPQTSSVGSSVSRIETQIFLFFIFF